jgi:septin family protein
MLFFVSERSISPLEAANLKRLAGFVNIIPVICHGDYYSKEEVMAIKRKIQADSDAQSIRWFDCRRVS